MSRHGFTLIELLLGLVLLTLLGIAITETLMATSRVTVRSMHALAIARTMVSAGALVREELGSSDAGEVRLPNPNAVEFGRTVGSSVVCGTADSIARLPAAEWRGVRWPEGGRDEAALLTDLSSGDWSIAPILSVRGGQCPDGSAAILLTLSSAAGTAVFVRVSEPVLLRAYLGGGSGWWGLAPASGLSPVQPFAGPLETPLQAMTSGTTGLRLFLRPLHGSDAVLGVPLGLP